MILDGAKMKKILYQDSRGHFGESGQLYIYTAPDSKKYLVKHKPLDVANEYISHQIAKLIGVPTSDAVLIKENDNLSVGIEYEADFQRASMNDFYGTEKYEHDDIPIFFGGTATYIKPVEVTKAKYADDDPLLAEAMAYLAFRYLVVMDDNIQVAFAHGNLISFDYAYAFNLTEDRLTGWRTAMNCISKMLLVTSIDTFLFCMGIKAVLNYYVDQTRTGSLMRTLIRF